jgi:glyoxylase-like metal-dependent hydrolase (beta-lactamase superfamily II)
VGDPETREALVLDPGDEVERVLEVLRRHSLNVRAIVSTHAHIDHVGGLQKLQQATGAPVLMHGDDLELYRHMDEQAAWLGVPPPPSARVDQLLREGDTVRWGSYAATVLHTPGHTPGSVSLYLPPHASRVQAGHADRVQAGHTGSAEAGDTKNGTLFAGDTLFAGSIGRTDLWGGSLEDILRSIRGKLLVLPDQTIVYPGHGAVTTIGDERASNPFLQAERPPQLGGRG